MDCNVAAVCQERPSAALAGVAPYALDGSNAERFVGAGAGSGETADMIALVRIQKTSGGTSFQPTAGAHKTRETARITLAPAILG